MLKRDLLCKLDKYAPLKGAKVLDAGTGPASFSYLARSGVKKLEAVSIDKREISIIQKTYPLLARKKSITLKHIDLSKKNGSKRNNYDVIVADNLFSAVEHFTPFNTIQVFSNLRKSLRLGGYLIIIGQEHPNRNKIHSYASIVRRLLLLAAATDSLVGNRAYVEYPSAWIASLATKHGLRLCKFRKYPKTINTAFMAANAESILRKTIKLPMQGIVRAIRQEVLTIMRKVHGVSEFKDGLTYGSYYIVSFVKQSSEGSVDEV